MSKKAILIFIPGGFIPQVPARDLTSDDFKRLKADRWEGVTTDAELIEILTSAGRYVEPGKSKTKTEASTS